MRASVKTKFVPKKGGQSSARRWLTGTKPVRQSPILNNQVSVDKTLLGKKIE